MASMTAFGILDEESPLVAPESTSQKGLCHVSARKICILSAASVAAAAIFGAMTGYAFLHEEVGVMDSNFGEVGSTALLNCPNQLADLSGDDTVDAFKVCATAEYPIGSTCQWTCAVPDEYGIRSLTCVNWAPPTEVPITTWIVSSEYPGATTVYSDHPCPPAPCTDLLFDLDGTGVLSPVTNLVCDPAATPPFASGSSCSFTCASGLSITASCSKAVWTTSRASCPPHGPNNGIQCGANLITLQDGAALTTYAGTGANVQNRPAQKRGLYRVEWNADLNQLFESIGACARKADDVVDPLTGLVVGPGDPNTIDIQVVKATVTVTTPVGSYDINYPVKMLNPQYLADPDLTLPQSIGTVVPATGHTLDIVWPAYDPTHPVCGGPLAQICAPVFAVGLFGFDDMRNPLDDRPWWPNVGEVVSFKVQLGLKYVNDPRVFTYFTDSGPISTGEPVYGGGIGKVAPVLPADPCNTGDDPRDAIPGLTCPPPQQGPAVPHVPPPPGVTYIDGANLPVIVPEPEPPAPVVPDPAAPVAPAPPAPVADPAAPPAPGTG